VDYFLGVDIGGTKSHALLTDGRGNAVGFSQAGPGNHEDVGYTGLIAVLTELLEQIERSTGINRAQIAGAGFGVAGYDWPSERISTLEAIAALGLTCPVDAVNDTIIGLLAGAEQGWGVALVAGTSNNCRGWDRAQREGRVLGNGPWFGEHGGAAELVMRAVRDVALAWTQRGPQTRLTAALVEYVGARDAADLLEGLSQETYVLNADAARLVVQVAQAGDEVAQTAVRWTAQELGSLAVGVIRQLSLQAEHFDIVLVGSFYNVGALLMEPLRASILAVAPHARLVRLAAPPVAGAVLLAMLAAGRETAAVRPLVVAAAQVAATTHQAGALP